MGGRVGREGGEGGSEGGDHLSLCLIGCLEIIYHVDILDVKPTD